MIRQRIKNFNWLSWYVLSILSSIPYSCLASDNENKEQLSIKSKIMNETCANDTFKELSKLFRKLSTNQKKSSSRENFPQEHFDQLCHTLFKTLSIEENSDYYIKLQRKDMEPGYEKTKIHIIRNDLSPLATHSLIIPTTAKEENYHHFFGKTEAHFERICSLGGTGIALNQEYILTLASCVTFMDNDPQSIIFHSYNSITKSYTHRIEVESVTYPALFVKFSKEEDQYDFALLKLATHLSIIKDQNFLFYDAPDPLQYSVRLYGFRKYYRELEIFNIEQLEKEDTALKYQTNAAPGVSSALLLMEKDRFYYIVGIHMGKKHQTQLGKALYLNADIQQQIQLMMSVLSDDSKKDP